MKQFIKRIIYGDQELKNEVKKMYSLNRSLSNQLNFLENLFIEDYLQTHLHKNPKYSDPKKLNKYEFKVYSQGGEDGIVEEIFKRIGTTNQFFVEFGVGNGLENNTAYLLNKGWSGHWLEGSKNYCKNIQKVFAELIKDKKLGLTNEFISAENIESLFAAANVPTELDFLCIDIDGNDYWVWQAIKNYRPRVVALEYNAMYPPQLGWTIKYNPQHNWDYSSYMGASLKALEKLGVEKGYRLVGCSFLGANSFFVREDLLGDHFLAPYTAENHYEPPRYFLVRQGAGHPRSFGSFELI
jgi:hypothetical protein